MDQKKKLHDIEEFDIEINGTNIRIASFEENKDRPYLIFLHDSLGCIPLWKDFPKRLAEANGCNWIVYDRIGYGKSGRFPSVKRDRSYLEKEADTLFQIMRALNLKKSILFGHSDGGSIALIAAAKFPEAVIGVITEGAHVFVEEITLIGIREAVVAYQTTKLKQVLEKYHSDKTEEVFKAWADTWLSEEFRNWNIERFLPNIQCPVLVIQGEKDEYGSEDQVNSIVNQVSGPSVKRMIQGVKHTPHKEVPNEILKEAGELIQKIVGNSTK
ncbi:alpha/beta fold hydrolase [Leptospira yasudae]|uniref:Alpha/beta hydrolase n=1 Tax=Leptospira yasudae TaxID=2202201 RepID=A0ABX9M5C5_9LEPT|nr:alpha/beta hydrolase [Leptospira yasudae]RHX80930.1 alpha/beta hydrolase [Leptospira yasudae]